MTHILVVEDDRHLGEGLLYNLTREGYDAELVATGSEALARIRQAAPRLVILDLMLPDVDGFRILQEIRAGGREPPVIILSARGEETDKIRGLDTGADDYVTKPFSIAELLARVRARLAAARTEAQFGLGSTAVDLNRHLVERDGVATPLTPTEVEILGVLRLHLDRPVDRDVLMRRVWGSGPTTSRTLDAHVARLRKKLEGDPARPRHLLTVHGVGYRLRP